MNLSPWEVDAGKEKRAIHYFFIAYNADKKELMDEFLDPEVLLFQGEKSKRYKGSNLVKAKVILHFCDEDSNIIGNVNICP